LTALALWLAINFLVVLMLQTLRRLDDVTARLSELIDQHK